MTAAARELLESLDDDGRAAAAFAFPSDEERTSWHYYPARRKGLAMARIDAPRQKLVHGLLETALSVPAHASVCAIVALEDVLDRLEQHALGRAPGGYFVSVFGEPGGERWAWRFEGHHVCVNITAVQDAVSWTPLFLGANPASVRRGTADVLRLLREEEDVARALLASLDRDQRTLAVVADKAPGDIVSGDAAQIRDGMRPGDNPRLVDADLTDAERDALALGDAPIGLPSAQMDERQRTLLSNLVAVYTDRVVEPPPTGEDVWFAWAGPDARGDGHYYRVQGSGFLAEYDNTQNDGNHVHAVWRTPGEDFGAVLFRGHRR